MKRAIITIVIFTILTVISISLWHSSKPIVLSSFSGKGASVTDHSVSPSRSLGGFTASKVIVRQWGKETPRVFVTGMIFNGDSRYQVSIGGSHMGFTVGESAVDWIGSIYSNELDVKDSNVELEVTLRFDFSYNTVTLLETGETFPYRSDRVYTVIVDQDLKVSDFVMLNGDEPLDSKENLLKENFKTIVEASKTMAEQDVAPDGE